MVVGGVIRLVPVKSPKKEFLPFWQSDEATLWLMVLNMVKRRHKHDFKEHFNGLFLYHVTAWQKYLFLYSNSIATFDSVVIARFVFVKVVTVGFCVLFGSLRAFCFILHMLLPAMANSVHCS